MKRLLTGALAILLSIAASATTLNPIQLLNPTGSSSGQAIVSTGSSTAPAWSNMAVANVTGAAALTGATFTGLVKVSYASGTFLISDTSGTGHAQIQFYNNSTNEWNLTNSSAVSNQFTLDRFVSGSYVDSPISVSNSTGVVTMSDGISGTPISGSTGSFTTLAASTNSAVFSTNTSAQSIPNGAFTTVTGWTAVTDRNSNWTISTGTFTAPRAGNYLVSAALSFASVAWPANTNLSLAVYKNGTEVAQATKIVDAAVTANQGVALPSVLVNCANSDALTIRVFQSQGAAVALVSTAASNWVSIVQVP